MIKVTLQRSRFSTKYGKGTYAFTAQNAVLGIRGQLWAAGKCEADRLARAELRKRTAEAKQA